jgi:hypothetical protein
MRSICPCWNCADAVQHHVRSGRRSNCARCHDVSLSPFARTIWSGTCDAEQLSSGELLDSSRHALVHLCPRYGSAPRWRPAPPDAGHHRHIGRHGPAHCGLALPGKTVRAMLNAGWPAGLAALSFFLTTNLSDPLFGDVIGALQALPRAAGFLALPTPHDAFLTSLAKAAHPPHIVAARDEPPQAQPTAPPCLARGTHTRPRRGWRRRRTATTAGAQPRNLACARALFAAALFLAGTLGPSWFAELEALQNGDYVLTTRGNTDGTASSTGMELRRLGLEALREILPGAPSSVGKQYSKCSAASASAPLLTTLGRPPLPARRPSQSSPAWLSAGEARQSTFGSA